MRLSSYFSLHSLHCFAHTIKCCGWDHDPNFQTRVWSLFSWIGCGFIALCLYSFGYKRVYGCVCARWLWIGHSWVDIRNDFFETVTWNATINEYPVTITALSKAVRMNWCENLNVICVSKCCTSSRYLFVTFFMHFWISHFSSFRKCFISGKLGGS